MSRSDDVDTMRQLNEEEEEGATASAKDASIYLSIYLHSAFRRGQRLSSYVEKTSSSHTHIE